MKFRVALSVLAVTILADVPVRAQAPAPEALLRRLGSYMGGFVDSLTNVVAEEQYLQQFRTAAPRRRLKSDFLLVKYPGEERIFLTFRDVLEVDGRPVRDQQERVMKLFLEPFESAVRRAGDIQLAALKYSIERGRLVDPFEAIAWLQTEYQKNFKFTVRGLEPSLGADVRVIDVERDIPANVSTGALHVRAWVSEASGRVVKTELRVGAGAAVRFTTTTFAFDPTLRIDVPLEMRDQMPTRNNDEFEGVARYSNFRRFQVRAEQEVELPPPTR
jgi:hypothetical protein